MKYKLALFDVDSTLIEQEVIDLIAARTKHGVQVANITERAMRGEIDFDEALKQRVQLLSGLPEKVFRDVLADISFSPGAVELIDFLRSHDFRIGIVSGGFHNVIDPLFAELKLDFVRANRLEIQDAELTGKTLGEIINRSAKAQALMDFASLFRIDISETVAVGDGSNDIEMIQLAGLGVSYLGKPALRNVADVCIDKPGLEALLDFLS